MKRRPGSYGVLADPSSVGRVRQTRNDPPALCRSAFRYMILSFPRPGALGREGPSVQGARCAKKKEASNGVVYISRQVEPVLPETIPE